MYQPGEPVEMRGVKRASTEESRVEGEGGQMDQDQDMEDDDEEFGDDEGVEDGVKMEEEEDGEEEEGREGEEMRNITKQSISAIIDNGPVQEKEHEHEKEQEQEHQSSGYPGHHERDTGSQSEKENTEPKDMR